MKKRTKTIIIFVLIILLAITAGSLVYLFNSHKLPYREPYRHMRFSCDTTSLNCSREEVRKDLNKLFGAKFYIYEEKNLTDAYDSYIATKTITEELGRSNPFTRVVIMDDSIPLYLYAFNLAHELVHLTHFTSSDRYCNLVAFKTLYNTEKYRDVALNYAINDREGRIPKSHSCWEYMVDYLILD